MRGFSRSSGKGGSLWYTFLVPISSSDSLLKLGKLIRPSWGDEFEGMS